MKGINIIAKGKLIKEMLLCTSSVCLICAEKITKLQQNREAIYRHWTALLMFKASIQLSPKIPGYLCGPIIQTAVVSMWGAASNLCLDNAILQCSIHLRGLGASMTVGYNPPGTAFAKTVTDRAFLELCQCWSHEPAEIEGYVRLWGSETRESPRIKTGTLPVPLFHKACRACTIFIIS